MNFFPQRLRSKSISAPLRCDQTASSSCPNLLDLDDDVSGDYGYTCSSKAAHTPGPELASMASSPKGAKVKKLQKSLFLLPAKFRRAKERKVQTQALKLPVYPLNSFSDIPSISMTTPYTVGPPLNVRPKHTRPTGLGLSLGQGLLGSDLTSPGGKMRRGSDSCILSPTSSMDRGASNKTDIEHSGEDYDTMYKPSPESLAQRRRTYAPPSPTPPIFLINRSGDERGSDGLKLKKYLGKSLEQVRF